MASLICGTKDGGTLKLLMPNFNNVDEAITNIVE